MRNDKNLRNSRVFTPTVLSHGHYDHFPPVPSVCWKYPQTRCGTIGGMSVTENHSGKSWEKADLFFMIDALARGMSIAEVAAFLNRSEDEVRQRANLKEEEIWYSIGA